MGGEIIPLNRYYWPYALCPEPVPFQISESRLQPDSIPITPVSSLHCLYRPFRAYIQTYPAIGAQNAIDADIFFILGLIFMINKGRALKLLDAIGATVAVFGDFHRDIFGGLAFSGQIDDAGISGYHNGRTVLSAVFNGLLHQGDKFFYLVGIAFLTKFYPAAANQGLRCRPFPAVRRMRRIRWSVWVDCPSWPWCGYPESPGQIYLLNHRVDQRRHPGMEKSRIPDGGHNIGPFFFIFIGMIKAGCLADGRPHTKHRIDRPQIQPQGVTADITGVYTSGGGFFNGKKAGPVRTSGTQRRASSRCKGYRKPFGFDPGKLADDLLNIFRIKLTNFGHVI